MDQKLAAYSARKIVEMINRDPAVSTDLKRVMTELMGAQLKTLDHRSTTLRSAIDAVIEISGEDDVTVDYLSVLDNRGKVRHLIYV